MCGLGRAARSTETRKVQQHRAEERKRLCRAVFQYRIVADAGAGSAGECGCRTCGQIIGYYSFVSVTLNVFEVPTPPGAKLLSDTPEH